MTKPSSKEERMWGMFCHLAGLSGFVLTPFGAIIGPLVIWLLKKEEFPFVDTQGKAALNFQMTMFICAFVSVLFMFALAGIGVVLFLAVVVTDLILTIVAAIKANEGETFQYPVTFTFIR